MDLSPSSPDLQNSSPEIVTDSNMAAATVAHPHSANMPGAAGSPGASNADPGNATGSTGKRYRPTPAKTFQCRGYGECRMVFSRSEHLARHIRKHTGERPFSCHCTKQFSRLDNLRQHAQTVHADKQEENERMMRDLTSLHATMSAVNKLGTSRGGRKGANAASTNGSGNKSLAPGGTPVILLKQEEMQQQQQRPGTSTGYESGEVMYNYNNSSNTTSSRNASNSSFRDQSQSFRESNQSFLGPPTSSPPTGAAPAAHTQSFLGYAGAQDHVADVPSRPPGSASSRPTTSSGIADSKQHSRSLPPLAAVVSASLSSASNQFQPPTSSGLHSTSSHHLQQQLHSQTPQPIFQFQPPAIDHTTRRPTTAYRPGTAPASASSFFAFSDRPGLGRPSNDRPDLSLLRSGFSGRPTSSSFGEQLYQLYQLGDSGEASASPGNDASPFYFNPPALNSTTGSSPVSNSRKRAFGGPDGPSEDSSQLRDRPSSSAGFFGELNYEYGSESRPQSRRLTVMELCTDDKSPRPASQRREQHPSGSSFLLCAPPYGSTSRPTTSGLVCSTSTLHIVDQPTSPSSGGPFGQQPAHVLSRTSPSAAGANGDGAARGTSAISRGSGFPVCRRVPSSTASSFPISSTSSPAPTFTPPGVLPLGSSTSDSSYSDATFSGIQRGQSHYAQQQYQQSYPQHKQQQLAQYQLAHSPTFSSASAGSNASCSPRSPLSDSSGSSSSSGSPFPAYAHPSARSSSSTAAVFAGGHHATNPYASSGIPSQRLHQQRDGQVGASASPHAASFGMRV